MTLPDFDLLWDYNEPAATETRFRDLLPAAEESGDQSYRLQLLTQIARTLSLQRKFDDAHALLDTVEAQLSQGDALVNIRYLLERGRTFNSSGEPEKALALFQQAWDEAEAANEDFHAVDAAHMVAIAEPSPEGQLEWNHKALVLAEATDDQRAKKWPGSLHNNIGWTYHDDGKYETALHHLEQALVWREKQGDIGLIRIAHWCIGRCLRSLGRLDEALVKQQDLLRQYEQDGTQDGYVYEELGECLYALQRHDEAKPYFALAYAELSQDSWLQANEAERLARLQQFSES